MTADGQMPQFRRDYLLAPDRRLGILMPHSPPACTAATVRGQLTRIRETVLHEECLVMPCVRCRFDAMVDRRYAAIEASFAAVALARADDQPTMEGDPMTDTMPPQKISVTMTWDERALFEAEAQRSGAALGHTIRRLALATLATPEAATPPARPAPAALPAPANTPAATNVPVVVPPIANDNDEAASAVPVIRLEPSPFGGERLTGATVRSQRTARRSWRDEIAAGLATEKARWAGVGAMSLALGLMLIPAETVAAAQVAKVVLGEPGDGIAASNQLFLRYSDRAGPVRHLTATMKLADNAKRLSACADAADRAGDRRQLVRCELYVPSRARALEVGQGIID